MAEKKVETGGGKAPQPPLRSLKVPRPEALVFPDNLIATAVCELRYPTLLEIETRSPADIQKALRKAYPNYEKKRRPISIRQGKVETEVVHEFRNRPGDWIVTLRPSAIALETSKYSTFEDFETRLTQAVKILSGEIDSPYFTRIGLRYINRIKAPENGSVEGVVNPILIAGLDVFGTVSEFQHTVRGWADETSMYGFRYGFSEEGDFTLDLDFYREDVEVPEALPVVRQLHGFAYSLFSWSLGPEGFSLMGEPTPKV